MTTATPPASPSARVASPAGNRQDDGRARAQDYAVLTLAWTLAAGALAYAVDRAEQPAPGTTELPLIALATFAVARTVSRERVESWLREPFVDESVPGRQRPRGTGARRAVGELLACTRCTGTWAALGVTAAWSLRPGGGRALVGALAATGANDLLQSSFARLAPER